MSKPAILMISNSTRTKGADGIPIYEGSDDFLFNKKHLKSFLKIYYDYFYLKDHPISRDSITISKTKQGVIVSVFLKGLDGFEVEDWMAFVHHAFTVIKA